jgi:uncharacterized protein (DUF2235 family)
VGLLHADADNLVPYALKLYAKSGGSTTDPSRQPEADAKKAERDFWRLRNNIRSQFGNPDFPNPFNRRRKQVHFVGVWDTVKSVGWLNLRARIEVARWPFTANIANVETACHALAIDERRRPFKEYRFTEAAVAAADGRFQEMWFAGVHGDIGGQNRDDSQLPDIAFSWMVKQAHTAGLEINEKRYEQMLGVGVSADLPDDRALGVIHPNQMAWWLAGGWRQRPIRVNDLIHPSVRYRIEATKNNRKPYRPRNLRNRA